MRWELGEKWDENIMILYSGIITAGIREIERSEISAKAEPYNNPISQQYSQVPLLISMWTGTPVSYKGYYMKPLCGGGGGGEEGRSERWEKGWRE